MPIVPPKSGATILTSDITTMFDAVADVIDDEPKENLGPNSFRADQLPSIIEAFEFKPVVAPVATAHGQLIGWSETGWADITQWADLPGYKLDNGGPGHDIDPCNIFAFCSLRVRRFGTLFNNDLYPAAFFNLYIEVAGTPQYSAQNNRFICQSMHTAYPSNWNDLCEHSVSIATWWPIVVPSTAVKVGLLHGLARGGHLLPNSIEVTAGHIGFVAFRRTL
jgi:hypothetical protein